MDDVDSINVLARSRGYCPLWFAGGAGAIIITTKRDKVRKGCLK